MANDLLQERRNVVKPFRQRLVGTVTRFLQLEIQLQSLSDVSGYAENFIQVDHQCFGIGLPLRSTF